MKTVDLREAKWRYRLNKVGETFKAGWNTAVENKEIAIPALLAVSTTVKGVTRITSKLIQNHAINKEIAYKERTIYDRSLGRYVELRKPLTKLTDAEILTIEERRAQGERLMLILNDMKLLKKR